MIRHSHQNSLHHWELMTRMREGFQMRWPSYRLYFYYSSKENSQKHDIMQSTGIGKENAARENKKRISMTWRSPITFFPLTCSEIRGEKHTDRNICYDIQSQTKKSVKQFFLSLDSPNPCYKLRANICYSYSMRVAHTLDPATPKL